MFALLVAVPPPLDDELECSEWRERNPWRRAVEEGWSGMGEVRERRRSGWREAIERTRERSVVYSGPVVVESWDRERVRERY